MQRRQAEEILQEYVQDEALRRHAYQVAAVMEYMGKQQGEQSDKWWMVGLLHDIDYELYPEQHCQKARELLISKGVDEEIIRAVESHGYGLCSQVKPESEMEKTLYAVDELTGLIYATALMRPSKSTLDMEVKSLKKKFKDKRFAAGVDREVIRKGAAMLGWEMDELMAETIAGMGEWEKNNAS